MRFSYVDELQQYIKVDICTDGPLTIFVDTFRLDFRDLKKQGVFVSPYHVLDLVERIGFDKTLASRQPVDKQLIELWTTAIFTPVPQYRSGLLRETGQRRPSRCGSA